MRQTSAPYPVDNAAPTLRLLRGGHGTKHGTSLRTGVPHTERPGPMQKLLFPAVRKRYVIYNLRPQRTCSIRRIETASVELVWPDTIVKARTLDSGSRCVRKQTTPRGGARANDTSEPTRFFHARPHRTTVKLEVTVKFGSQGETLLKVVHTETKTVPAATSGILTKANERTTETIPGAHQMMHA